MYFLMIGCRHNRKNACRVSTLHLWISIAVHNFIAWIYFVLYLKTIKPFHLYFWISNICVMIMRSTILICNKKLNDKQAHQVSATIFLQATFNNQYVHVFVNQYKAER